MEFRCSSSKYRLINSGKKIAQSLAQKIAIKYMKKKYRNDQKKCMLPTCDNIQTFFNISTCQTFRQNLNAFLLKKWIWIKKILI